MGEKDEENLKAKYRSELSEIQKRADDEEKTVRQHFENYKEKLSLKKLEKLEKLSLKKKRKADEDVQRLENQVKKAKARQREHLAILEIKPGYFSEAIKSHGNYYPIN